MEQCNAIAMKNKHVIVSSWDEEAFAEDSMGPLGGFIWPPRSYFCNFCSREFKSAQALGGHMNVHRRDRAKLHQSQQTQASEISTRKLGQRTMLKCDNDDDEEEEEEQEEEEGIIGLSNKKQRKDGVPTLQIFQKLCSSDGFVDLKKKSSMEEIDLELRLGDSDPAVK